VRRWVALGAVALALLTPACGGGTERPEGLVERWLISLNQGAAGRPDRYADDAVSEQVLPGWRNRDPGALDVIQVGTSSPGEGGIAQVPFRIETLDGEATLALANVETGRIAGIVMPDAVTPPSAWEPGTTPTGWIVAGLAGIALAALAAGLVLLVRPRRA
jgi:hypothetical protein